MKRTYIAKKIEMSAAQQKELQEYFSSPEKYLSKSPNFSVGTDLTRTEVQNKTR